MGLQEAHHISRPGQIPKATAMHTITPIHIKTLAMSQTAALLTALGRGTVHICRRMIRASTLMPRHPTLQRRNILIPSRPPLTSPHTRPTTQPSTRVPTLQSRQTHCPPRRPLRLSRRQQPRQTPSCIPTQVPTKTTPLPPTPSVAVTRGVNGLAL